MGTLLETSYIIEAERAGRGPLAGVPDEDVGIAAITAAELLRGVYLADAVHRLEREAAVERLLARVQIIPFDLEVARVHARLWAGLRASGSLIGPADLQIASTAVAIQWPVATLNVREFERVPGLSLWVPPAP